MIMYNTFICSLNTGALWSWTPCRQAFLACNLLALSFNILLTLKYFCTQRIMVKCTCHHLFGGLQAFKIQILSSTQILLQLASTISYKMLSIMCIYQFSSSFDKEQGKSKKSSYTNCGNSRTHFIKVAQRKSKS